jgi:superfamily II DNA/RNA helicase
LETTSDTVRHGVEDALPTEAAVLTAQTGVHDRSGREDRGGREGSAPGFVDGGRARRASAREARTVALEKIVVSRAR